MSNATLLEINYCATGDFAINEFSKEKHMTPYSIRICNMLCENHDMVFTQHVANYT